MFFLLVANIIDKKYETYGMDVSPIKIIRTRKLNIQKYTCLICGKVASKDNQRKPGEQGLSKFIYAFNVRKICNGFTKQDFSEFIDFENEIWLKEKENVRWHKNCYASYCSSQNLSTFQTFRNLEEGSGSSTPSTRSKTLSLDFKTKCLFCKLSKRKGDTNLIRIYSDETVDKIRTRCKEINDVELLRLVAGDFSELQALEARYHKNCYNLYLKQDTTSSSNKESIHDICFKLLIEETIEPALTEGRALKICNVLAKYKDFLREKNYDTYESYTTQKLKHKLLTHYGSKICITSEINQGQFLYSSSINISEVFELAADYKQMLRDKELIESSDTRTDMLLERTAELLKVDISNTKGISTQPLDPMDITDERVIEIVPESLKTFLDKLCRACGKNNKKLLSISQDIITLFSNGRKRMPKQVGLGISLKNSLRSKEFITYLNNLGHSICYDEVLRIETRWASDILEKGDGFATLPSNLSKDFFTQAASDNGDYGQENTSQHITNTVLYQYGNFGSANTSSKSKIVSRKRSVLLPPTLLEEETFIKKPTCPSKFRRELFAKIFLTKQSDEFINEKMITWSWVLLRMTGNKVFDIEIANKQKVPSWTGFRKCIDLKVSSPTKIGNCRSIPASPTDINVVYTMLINVKKMLINLGQSDPCITVDESIYAIAKKIQWQVPALQDITIRLGGFHRAKNFLGIIGKRMKSSGFEVIATRFKLFKSTYIEGTFFNHFFS